MFLNTTDSHTSTYKFRVRQQSADQTGKWRALYGVRRTCRTPHTANVGCTVLSAWQLATGLLPHGQISDKRDARNTFHFHHTDVSTAVYWPIKKRGFIGNRNECIVKLAERTFRKQLKCLTLAAPVSETITPTKGVYISLYDSTSSTPSLLFVVIYPFSQEKNLTQRWRTPIRYLVKSYTISAVVTSRLFQYQTHCDFTPRSTKRASVIIPFQQLPGIKGHEKIRCTKNHNHHQQQQQCRRHQLRHIYNCKQ